MAESTHPLTHFSRKYAPLFAVFCTVVLILMWNNSGPTSILVSGHQFVEGEAEVQAGPLKVQVNGRTSVVVTPNPGSLSVSDLKETSRYSLPAQLSGASVVITVHKGTASFFDHDGKKTTLGPGETKTYKKVGE